LTSADCREESLNDSSEDRATEKSAGQSSTRARPLPRAGHSRPGSTVSAMDERAG
jgi:hypothetical protein